MLDPRFQVRRRGRLGPGAGVARSRCFRGLGPGRWLLASLACCVRGPDVWAEPRPVEELRKMPLEARGGEGAAAGVER